MRLWQLYAVLMLLFAATVGTLTLMSRSGPYVIAACEFADDAPFVREVCAALGR